MMLEVRLAEVGVLDLEHENFPLFWGNNSEFSTCPSHADRGILVVVVQKNELFQKDPLRI